MKAIYENFGVFPTIETLKKYIEIIRKTS